MDGPKPERLDYEYPGFQPRDKAIKYKTVREERMIEIVKKMRQIRKFGNDE